VSGQLPPVSETLVLGGDPIAKHLAPAQGADEIGRLDGFRILRLLGRGGMGAVLLAEDVHLRRQVAIKIMLPHIAADANQRERFLREARTAAGLEHDHIASILQVGEAQGLPFFVMPLLRGESLEDRLGRSPDLSLKDAVRVGIEVAEALAYAHARGLIHRDIKPANLWLEEADSGRLETFRRVKILDFGLARQAARIEPGLTQTGAVLGTPGYLAPEQAEGKVVDGRADLFSLGCVLYRLTTGQLPFPGDTILLRLANLATSTPLCPHSLNERVPRPLSDLISQLLEKNPDRRCSSATETGRRLKEIARGLEPSAASDEPKASKATKSRQSAAVSSPAGVPLSLGGDDTQPLTFADERKVKRPQRIAVVAILGTILGAALSGILWYSMRSSDFEPNAKGKKIAPDGVPAHGLNAVRADVKNSLGMHFVLVPAGEFVMGSPNDEPWREDRESPQHKVTIRQPFLMSAFETTQAQYLKIMGINPSYYKQGGGGEARLAGVADTSNFPVDSVSWHDAELFCQRLADLEEERNNHRTYRLPTEAEWEYACRGGKTTAFSTGDSLTTDQAAIAESTPPGPVRDVSRRRPEPVGRFAPNGFGLFDMHGNVAEWCYDWFADRYPDGEQKDPKGPKEGENRVVRGGNCGAPAHLCRSAARSALIPMGRTNNLGFRIVMEKAK
jgi:formylglycine-generating enzyme required for sulfatase activity